MEKLLQSMGLGLGLILAIACSGGGGSSEESQQSISFKAGQDFTATVRNLESVSSSNLEALQTGEVVGTSSYDSINERHEVDLNSLDDYEVDVSINGVSIFKTIVFSDELTSGTGPLDLGYINAGSTLFTELALANSRSKAKWNELMAAYGMLDAYSGRRDVRLSSLIERDNASLSDIQKQQLGMRILASRLFMRILEANDSGDEFWSAKNKSDSELWSELLDGADQAISSGDVDLDNYFRTVFGTYYAKYRPLTNQIEDRQGNDFLVVNDGLGNAHSIELSTIPELNGVSISTVGVLQRWSMWDEMASLLGTMASGDLLAGSPFSEAEEVFRTFDDRSTGVTASGQAFDDSFGYDRYLVGVRVTLILLSSTGNTPTVIVSDLDLTEDN